MRRLLPLLTFLVWSRLVALDMHVWIHTDACSELLTAVYKARTRKTRLRRSPGVKARLRVLAPRLQLELDPTSILRSHLCNTRVERLCTGISSRFEIQLSHANVCMYGMPMRMDVYERPINDRVLRVALHESFPLMSAHSAKVNSLRAFASRVNSALEIEDLRLRIS